MIALLCIFCSVTCLTFNRNNAFADTTGGSDDPCYNANLDSMSWIICPVVNNTSSTVDGIEKTLRDWLTIKPEEVFGNGTYQGWEFFRDFANAMSIIVLLVVIFSQLTGLGIDNYGIKKMLPRLILMAILINLSYLICQIAVDLSNILGTGFGDLFRNLGEGIATTNGINYAELSVAGIVAGLLGSLAGAGAIAGTAVSVAAVASGGGVMLVISLILMLLVALVAVLMFFVMLGARMLIVIIFTIIAPVAFALYILPNTQNLFKKWWQVFKAALIVFPICGALYGAKYIIQAIVFAPNGGEVDFILPLIGVCAPFLPFLLLPSLLKSALAGLGALGNTISMLGNGVKKGIKSGNNALQNTDAYKSAQEKSRRNMTRWKAGLDKNGNRIDMDNSKFKGRFRRFIRGGDTGITASRLQHIKDEEAKIQEANVTGANFAPMLASSLAGARAKVDDQNVKNQKALLAYGQATYGDGKRVNVNDLNSVSGYHASALGDYHNANNDEERNIAMAKIKAAQDILSKTDKGRAYVEGNYEQAIEEGATGGLSDAAAHIADNYGDLYKTKNRGGNKLIEDLASIDVNNPDDAATLAALDTIKNNIESGKYDAYGVSSYTQETIAGADDTTLERFHRAAYNGSLSDEDAGKLRELIQGAKSNPRIQIQDKIKVKLDDIERVIDARLSGKYSSNSQAPIRYTNDGNELDIQH